jgi:isopentenyl-diphosphate delta-isomerase
MLVDIVDERNRIVGASRRSLLLERGLGFRTVHVLVFDRTGRVLLQKLRNDHPRSPGKLGSSVAGYVQTGESYKDAAERKIREELGIQPQLVYFGYFAMRDQESRKFVALFTSRIRDERIAFDTAEMEDVVRMDVHNVDTLVRREPERFTATFLDVYDFYRHRRKSKRRRAKPRP